MNTINSLNTAIADSVKRYPLVLIEWMDAIEDSEGIIDLENDAPRYLMEMHSVGFLIKGKIGEGSIAVHDNSSATATTVSDKRDMVEIVQTVWDCENRKFASKSLTIPESWVINIVELVAKREEEKKAKVKRESREGKGKKK
jgi:hypothetical protein